MIWQGATKNGYGIVRIGGRDVRMHRLMYEEHVGPLGDQTLHHICRVKRCVNPKHLTPTRQRDHNWLHRSEMCLRCGANDWGVQVNEGYECRYCRPCSRANARRQYARHRVLAFGRSAR